MRRLFWAYGVLSMLFYICVFAEEEDAPSWDAVNTFLPQTMVGGAVDAAGGGFHINESDLVVTGKEPLVFKRSYNSHAVEKISGGWDIKLSHTKLHLLAHYSKKDEPYFSRKEYHFLKRIMYEEEDGTRLIFDLPQEIRCDVDHPNKGPIECILSEEHSDVKRISVSKFLGRDDIRKVKLTFVPANRSVIVTDGAGSVKTFRMKPELLTGGTLKDASDTIYYLVEEKKANGNRIRYHYVNGPFLKRIESRSPSGDKVYAWIDFDRKVSTEKIFYKMTTSDDKTAEFEVGIGSYSNFRKQFLLKNSFFSHLPKERFEYVKRKGLLDFAVTKRILGGIGEQVVEYHYENGTVKRLQHTVSSDGSLTTTHEFQYHSKKDSSITEVFDAFQNMTRYHFNKYGKTTKIEFFQKNGKDQKLLCSETYNYNSDAKNPLLLVKAIRDANGNVITASRFFYDERNSLIEERLYGNITGKGGFVSLDEKGYPLEGNEYTFHRYNYNSNCLLVKEEVPSGLTVLYSYLSNTNLVSSKITVDKHSVAMREFFFYDNDFNLIREIKDDGNGNHVNDLSGVTQRYLKNIKPRDGPTFIGLPDEVEERFLNVASGQEELFHKVKYHYNNQGKIEREDHYDRHGTYVYSYTKKYNKQGRLVEEVNPEGIVCRYEYDEIGNKTKEKIDFLGGKIKSSSPLSTPIENHFEYDKAGRLIRVLKDALSEKHSIHYKYDLKGNKISEIDARGHEHIFKYDALGNCIESKGPLVIAVDGRSYRAVQRMEYSVQGKICRLVNPQDETTLTEYNVFGKPVLIRHPDGSEERFRYNLEGYLLESVDQEGNRTVFEYDSLHRPILKRVYSVSGELLSTEKMVYKGFHLREKHNTNGVITYFYYDSQGHVVREESQTKYGLEVVEYAHDSLGRECQITSIEGANRLTTTIEYDLLNRPIIKRKASSKLGVVSQEEYTYDIHGKKISTQYLSQKGYKQERVRYDSLGRIVLRTDAEGLEYHYVYDDYYINPHGQKVLRVIETDPLGGKTERIHDPAGNVIYEIKYSPYGFVIAQEQFTRDAQGRIISQKSLIHKGKEVIGETQTIWEYGVRDRVVAITEAFGSKEQTTYRFTYTKKGFVKALNKPDGVSIFYSYDLNGRRKELKASDGSCHYYYEYDPQGSLISVFDQVNHIDVERTLDDRGRTLTEKILGRLEVRKEYDLLGRNTALTLMDGSQIEYVYDEVYLREVIRRDGEGHKKYSHSFKKYDFTGELLEEERIDSSLVTYKYTKNGRLAAIKSPKFSQSVNNYDGLKRPTKITSKDVLRNVGVEYSYDDYGHLQSEIGKENCHYVYDSQHNRLVKNNQAYLVNVLNQTFAHEQASYKYDLAGNLLVKIDSKGTTCYSYDALDRLTRVDLPDHSFTIYYYDGLDRRLGKSVYDSNGNLQKSYCFIFDNLNEIGIVDAQTEEIISLRVLGLVTKAEIGAAIAIEHKGRSYLPSEDIFGNIIAITALNEPKPTEIWSYSAFGEIRAFDGFGKEIPIKDTILSWTYFSKYLDKETGLINFGRRYYNSELGKWMTRDPKGYINGLNVYAFMLNDPITKIDLYGLTALQNGLTNLHNNRVLIQCHLAMFKENMGDPSKSGNINELIQPLSNPFTFPILLYKKYMQFTPPIVKELPGERKLANDSFFFVNGMLTSKKGFESHLRTFQNSVSNEPVKGVYLPFRHGIGDIGEALYAKLGGELDTTAVLHQELLNEWKTHGKDHYINLILHSKGNFVGDSLLKKLTPEEKAHLRILTFGSPCLFQDKGLHFLQHNVAERDLIPLLDHRILMPNTKINKIPSPHPVNMAYDDYEVMPSFYLGTIRMEEHDFQYPENQKIIQDLYDDIKKGIK